MFHSSHKSLRACNLFIMQSFYYLFITLVLPNFLFIFLFSHGGLSTNYKYMEFNTGICVTVDTRSYRHTENISLDFEPNRYYLMKINRNS